jgi:hypothetical protein
MYNLIILIIMAVSFAGLLVYLHKESDRRDKAEKDRFREFVRAVKAKDSEEYNIGLPEDSDLPMQEEDELVDLDQVEPEELLRAIKR